MSEDKNPVSIIIKVKNVCQNHDVVVCEEWGKGEDLAKPINYLLKENEETEHKGSSKGSQQNVILNKLPDKERRSQLVSIPEVIWRNYNIELFSPGHNGTGDNFSTNISFNNERMIITIPEMGLNRDVKLSHKQNSENESIHPFNPDKTVTVGEDETVED